ncbi:GntR family transcriptional regulator [Saccharothrix coeruleofusca]|uniref:GntR family transcriptional regulator n=1 Tax=Saccharothrix coeruleofusca TaxID=33919 RepID=A0A918EAR3_9PSEU|nr:GntR family transcriptional regulator [Saccharothrix coeruleofusca]GGP36419.1 GntR family transcriptional regulator [Saccharothrix coeruleofusca]
MTGSFEGRPAYLRIADDLRRQILDGELRDGDRLPTAQEIMDDYGVSRIVVRDAINLLRSEGLVRTQQGSGSYVRRHKPLKKRVMGDLYAKRPTSSPVAQSAQAAGKTADWEYQSRATKATRAVADRLGIELGDDVRAPRPFETDKLEVPQGVPVMAVERTYYAGDRPVETADIIVPADRYALSYTIRIPEVASESW